MSSGSGTAALTFSYTVQPNDSTADLQVQSLLTNGGTIKDGNGNDAGLANAATDLHLQVDTTAPSASSIVAAGANPNNATVETFTVTFSESVAGVDATDFTAATTGTVADTGIAVTAVSGSVYTVTVNGVTGDGTLGLNLNASGTGIADAAGNAISGGATGQIYTVGHTPPTVTSINTADASSNNLSTEHFTVTFSTDVSLNPPDITDFSLHATGTVSGTVASVAAVSGSVYTVTVTGVTGDGTLRLDLNTSGSTITDAVRQHADGGAHRRPELYHRPHRARSADVGAGARYRDIECRRPHQRSGHHRYPGRERRHPALQDRRRHRAFRRPRRTSPPTARPMARIW